MVRLILISTLALVGFIAVRYYLDYRSSMVLTESISAGEGVSSVLFVPSFPSPFVQLNGTGILAVSTGEVSDSEFINAQSGETIGKASVLDTVTRDSVGKLKEIRFILQLSSIANSQRNLIPWINTRAFQLRKLLKPKSGENITNNQLAQIFPKGSKWILIPALDLDSIDIWETLPEYQFYVRSYYGGKLAKFRNFVERGLSGSWKMPIPLLDIFYLFP